MILIISTYYILCISWIIKCLILIDARCKHEDYFSGSYSEIFIFPQTRRNSGWFLKELFFICLISWGIIKPTRVIITGISNHVYFFFCGVAAQHGPWPPHS